jgi:hypothetical protein
VAAAIAVAGEAEGRHPIAGRGGMIGRAGNPVRPLAVPQDLAETPPTESTIHTAQSCFVHQRFSCLWHQRCRRALPRVQSAALSRRNPWKALFSCLFAPAGRANPSAIGTVATGSPTHPSCPDRADSARTVQVARLIGSVGSDSEWSRSGGSRPNRARSPLSPNRAPRARSWHYLQEKTKAGPPAGVQDWQALSLARFEAPRLGTYRWCRQLHSAQWPNGGRLGHPRNE